jgi:CRISPR-associated protein Cas2
MRTVFLVCYDISDDKRLRQVYKAMRGFGDHLQLSVFRCELSAREHAEMVSTLTSIINHDEDQVLIVDIGPPDGRAESAFEAIGRPYRPPFRQAIII